MKPTKTPFESDLREAQPLTATMFGRHCLSRCSHTDISTYAGVFVCRRLQLRVFSLFALVFPPLLLFFLFFSFFFALLRRKNTAFRRDSINLVSNCYSCRCTCGLHGHTRKFSDEGMKEDIYAYVLYVIHVEWCSVGKICISTGGGASSTTKTEYI